MREPLLQSMLSTGAQALLHSTADYEYELLSLDWVAPLQEKT